jgi:uncharacterized protein (TIGR02466 family)
MNIDNGQSHALCNPHESTTRSSHPGIREAAFTHLFSVPLLSHIWTDALPRNAELRARILAHAQSDAGDKVTNVGGWRSATGHLEFLGDLRDWLLERMLAMVNEATRRVTAERGLAPVTPSWSFAAWANVSRGGDFHATHTHAGATWSGVYYVATGDSGAKDESGRLRFIDPSPGSAIFLPFLARAVPEVRPRPGLMILFPSYVPHTVHPHRGAAERISIAFNFRNEPFP